MIYNTTRTRARVLYIYIYTMEYEQTGAGATLPGRLPDPCRRCGFLPFLPMRLTMLYMVSSLYIYILGGAGEQRSRAQPARARAQRRRPCAAGERSEGAQRPSAGGRPKGGSAATQRRAACRRPLQDPGTRRSVGPEILPPVPPVRAQTDTASTEYFTSLRTGGLRPQQPARRDCPSPTSLLLQALFFFQPPPDCKTVEVVLRLFTDGTCVRSWTQSAERVPQPSLAPDAVGRD